MIEFCGFLAASDPKNLMNPSSFEEIHYHSQTLQSVHHEKLVKRKKYDSLQRMVSDLTSFFFDSCIHSDVYREKTTSAVV